MTIQFEHSIHHNRPRFGRAALALLLASLTFSACGTSARELPAAQPRPLEALLDVAAYPNAETLVVMSALQQLLASHHEWQGYEFFGRLAREQPDQSLEGRAFGLEGLGG